MKLLAYATLLSTALLASSAAADYDSNVIPDLNIVTPDSICGTTEHIWDTLINDFGGVLNVMSQEGGLAVFYVKATGLNYVVVGNADNACLIASY